MSGIMADEEEKEVVSEKLDKKESDKIEEEPKPKSQVERLFLKDEHWLCTQCGQRQDVSDFICMKCLKFKPFTFYESLAHNPADVT